jgi:hypothetical protein
MENFFNGNSEKLWENFHQSLVSFSPQNPSVLNFKVQKSFLLMWSGKNLEKLFGIWEIILVISFSINHA